ncbi:MAG: carnitine 3-dehydrogenase [Dinoroseobacter sp.]|jgi:carnitine 3-dehydrogenase
MNTAAILGGGVIGGGWAARFLLMGWDVRVFDPDPEASRKIDAVLANARRSLPGLYDAALPPEGTLSYHATISEAVAGASWVQESVPERLELKQKLYQTAQAAMDEGAILASSTSGFTPTQLQNCATRPEQILVAHPFNPVYLLPLVELVASDKNRDLADRAAETLSGLGMFPLKVRGEIDAHIADRLLEAVWREALWLVKDGIATTVEIDEAIRMGFGLRWAQMGLFETYRIAGGEAGMGHFLAQFGPALKWPWTKLMDVPELTDDLVKMIADQSDAQSGALSIRELEAKRDTSLVSILRALKAKDAGAGAVLNATDKTLTPDPGPETAPMVTASRAVPLDWTDYNAHMNEARYVQAFSEATDRFMEIIGADAAYVEKGGSYFTVESHIRYLAEANTGDVITITTQCLMGAGKKLHLFHNMHRGDTLLATGEHMLLHVSLQTRRTAPPQSPVAETLARIASAHAALPAPEGSGKLG